MFLCGIHITMITTLARDRMSVLTLTAYFSDIFIAPSVGSIERGLKCKFRFRSEVNWEHGKQWSALRLYIYIPDCGYDALGLHDIMYTGSKTRNSDEHWSFCNWSCFLSDLFVIITVYREPGVVFLRSTTLICRSRKQVINTINEHCYPCSVLSKHRKTPISKKDTLRK